MWAKSKEEEKPPSCARAKKRIIGLNVWLQSFTTYEEVIAPVELMAYLINIIRATQEYEGSAWVVYDLAYRCQATTTGHKKWS